MAGSAGPNDFGGRTSVRVVVVGDGGTGKSSLIVTIAAQSFPENVPSVLPPTRLPSDFYPDRAPITIIDTSSSPEHRGKLATECKLADAVLLTYACDQPSTLDRLSTFWLPELRWLEVKVPVIAVGCKLDLRDEQQQVSLEQVMSLIMQQFREIETCIECSALKQVQVRCFSAPLQPSEIVGVKKVVQEKGHLETTWTVLRKFGYDNDMKLREDLIPVAFKRAPDQSVELTNEAVEFLKGIFFMFDIEVMGHYGLLSSMISFQLHPRAGAAVAIIGLAAYRVYAARKNMPG